MKSVLIAFSMYSKLPVPQVEWDEKSLSWALCAFPAVGAAAGLLLWLWLSLAGFLGLGAALRGAVALLIPIALSGGIHLDGFCDTADALGSHQSREKKLEILKDVHVGAFAVFCCGLYLILFFAAWCEAAAPPRTALVLALGPVLSRTLSALAAVTQPNARGSGLLASFTAPMDAVKARWILGAWGLLCATGMLCCDLWTGAASLISAGASFLWYLSLSRRRFGGVTGDLSGFFLQICECAMVLAVALAQRAEVLL